MITGLFASPRSPGLPPYHAASGHSGGSPRTHSRGSSPGASPSSRRRAWPSPDPAITYSIARQLRIAPSALQALARESLAQAAAAAVASGEALGSGMLVPRPLDGEGSGAPRRAAPATFEFSGLISAQVPQPGTSAAASGSGPLLQQTSEARGTAGGGSSGARQPATVSFQGDPIGTSGPHRHNGARGSLRTTVNSSSHERHSGGGGFESPGSPVRSGNPRTTRLQRGDCPTAQPDRTSGGGNAASNRVSGVASGSPSRQRQRPVESALLALRLASPPASPRQLEAQTMMAVTGRPGPRRRRSPLGDIAPPVEPTPGGDPPPEQRRGPPHQQLRNERSVERMRRTGGRLAAGAAGGGGFRPDSVPSSRRGSAQPLRPTSVPSSRPASVSTSRPGISLPPSRPASVPLSSRYGPARRRPAAPRRLRPGAPTPAGAQSDEHEAVARTDRSRSSARSSSRPPSTQLSSLRGFTTASHSSMPNSLQLTEMARRNLAANLPAALSLGSAGQGQGQGEGRGLGTLGRRSASGLAGVGGGGSAAAGNGGISMGSADPEAASFGMPYTSWSGFGPRRHGSFGTQPPGGSSASAGQPFSGGGSSGGCQSQRAGGGRLSRSIDGLPYQLVAGLPGHRTDASRLARSSDGFTELSGNGAGRGMGISGVESRSSGNLTGLSGSRGNGRCAVTSGLARSSDGLSARGHGSGRGMDGFAHRSHFARTTDASGPGPSSSGGFLAPGGSAASKLPDPNWAHGALGSAAGSSTHATASTDALDRSWIEAAAMGRGAQLDILRSFVMDRSGPGDAEGGRTGSGTSGGAPAAAASSSSLVGGTQPVVDLLCALGARARLLQETPTLLRNASARQPGRVPSLVSQGAAAVVSLPHISSGGGSDGRNAAFGISVQPSGPSAPEAKWARLGGGGSGAEMHPFGSTVNLAAEAADLGRSGGGNFVKLDESAAGPLQSGGGGGFAELSAAEAAGELALLDVEGVIRDFERSLQDHLDFSLRPSPSRDQVSAAPGGSNQHAGQQAARSGSGGGLAPAPSAAARLADRFALHSALADFRHAFDRLRRRLALHVSDPAVADALYGSRSITSSGDGGSSAAPAAGGGGGPGQHRPSSNPPQPRGQARYGGPAAQPRIPLPPWRPGGAGRSASVDGSGAVGTAAAARHAITGEVGLGGLPIRAAERFSRMAAEAVAHYRDDVALLLSRVRAVLQPSADGAVRHRLRNSSDDGGAGGGGGARVGPAAAVRADAAQRCRLEDLAADEAAAAVRELELRRRLVSEVLHALEESAHHLGLQLVTLAAAPIDLPSQALSRLRAALHEHLDAAIDASTGGDALVEAGPYSSPGTDGAAGRGACHAGVPTASAGGDNNAQYGRTGGDRDARHISSGPGGAGGRGRDGQLGNPTADSAGDGRRVGHAAGRRDGQLTGDGPFAMRGAQPLQVVRAMYPDGTGIGYADAGGLIDPDGGRGTGTRRTPATGPAAAAAGFKTPLGTGTGSEAVLSTAAATADSASLGSEAARMQIRIHSWRREEEPAGWLGDMPTPVPAGPPGAVRAESEAERYRPAGHTGMAAPQRAWPGGHANDGLSGADDGRHAGNRDVVPGSTAGGGGPMVPPPAAAASDPPLKSRKPLTRNAEAAAGAAAVAPAGLLASLFSSPTGEILPSSTSTDDAISTSCSPAAPSPAPPAQPHGIPRNHPHPHSETDLASPVPSFLSPPSSTASPVAGSASRPARAWPVTRPSASSTMDAVLQGSTTSHTATTAPHHYYHQLQLQQQQLRQVTTPARSHSSHEAEEGQQRQGPLLLRIETPPETWRAGTAALRLSREARAARDAASAAREAALAAAREAASVVGLQSQQSRVLEAVVSAVQEAAQMSAREAAAAAAERRAMQDAAAAAVREAQEAAAAAARQAAGVTVLEAAVVAERQYLQVAARDAAQADVLEAVVSAVREAAEATARQAAVAAEERQAAQAAAREAAQAAVQEASIVAAEREAAELAARQAALERQAAQVAAQEAAQVAVRDAVAAAAREASELAAREAAAAARDAAQVAAQEAAKATAREAAATAARDAAERAARDAAVAAAREAAQAAAREAAAVAAAREAAQATAREAASAAAAREAAQAAAREASEMAERQTALAAERESVQKEALEAAVSAAREAAEAARKSVQAAALEAAQANARDRAAAEEREAARATALEEAVSVAREAAHSIAQELTAATEREKAAKAERDAAVAAAWEAAEAAERRAQQAAEREGAAAAVLSAAVEAAQEAAVSAAQETALAAAREAAEVAAREAAAAAERESVAAAAREAATLAAARKAAEVIAKEASAVAAAASEAALATAREAAAAVERHAAQAAEREMANANALEAALASAREMAVLTAREIAAESMREATVASLREASVMAERQTAWEAEREAAQAAAMEAAMAAAREVAVLTAREVAADSSREAAVSSAREVAAAAERQAERAAELSAAQRSAFEAALALVHEASLARDAESVNLQELAAAAAREAAVAYFQEASFRESTFAAAHEEAAMAARDAAVAAARVAAEASAERAAAERETTAAAVALAAEAVSSLAMSRTALLEASQLAAPFVRHQDRDRQGAGADRVAAPPPPERHPPRRAKYDLAAASPRVPSPSAGSGPSAPTSAHRAISRSEALQSPASPSPPAAFRAMVRELPQPADAASPSSLQPQPLPMPPFDAAGSSPSARTLVVRPRAGLRDYNGAPLGDDDRGSDDAAVAAAVAAVAAAYEASCPAGQAVPPLTVTISPRLLELEAGPQRVAGGHSRGRGERRDRSSQEARPARVEMAQPPPAPQQQLPAARAVQHDQVHSSATFTRYDVNGGGSGEYGRVGRSLHGGGAQHPEGWLLAPSVHAAVAADTGAGLWPEADPAGPVGAAAAAARGALRRASVPELSGSAEAGADGDLTLQGFRLRRQQLAESPPPRPRPVSAASHNQQHAGPASGRGGGGDAATALTCTTVPAAAAAALDGEVQREIQQFQLVKQRLGLVESSPQPSPPLPHLDHLDQRQLQQPQPGARSLSAIELSSSPTHGPFGRYELVSRAAVTAGSAAAGGVGRREDPPKGMMEPEELALRLRRLSDRTSQLQQRVSNMTRGLL